MRQHFEQQNTPLRDKSFYNNPGRFRLQNQRNVIYNEDDSSNEEVVFYELQSNDHKYIKRDSKEIAEMKNEVDLAVNQVINKDLIQTNNNYATITEKPASLEQTHDERRDTRQNNDFDNEPIFKETEVSLDDVMSNEADNIGQEIQENNQNPPKTQNPNQNIMNNKTVYGDKKLFNQGLIKKAIKI